MLKITSLLLQNLFKVSICFISDPNVLLENYNLILHKKKNKIIDVSLFVSPEIVDIIYNSHYNIKVSLINSSNTIQQNGNSVVINRNTKSNCCLYYFNTETYVHFFQFNYHYDKTSDKDDTIFNIKIELFSTDKCISTIYRSNIKLFTNNIKSTNSHNVKDIIKWFSGYNMIRKLINISRQGNRNSINNHNNMHNVDISNDSSGKINSATSNNYQVVTKDKDDEYNLMSNDENVEDFHDCWMYFIELKKRYGKLFKLIFKDKNDSNNFKIFRSIYSLLNEFNNDEDYFKDKSRQIHNITNIKTTFKNIYHLSDKIGMWFSYENRNYSTFILPVLFFTEIIKYENEFVQQYYGINFEYEIDMI